MLHVGELIPKYRGNKRILQTWRGEAHVVVIQDNKGTANEIRQVYNNNEFVIKVRVGLCATEPCNNCERWCIPLCFAKKQQTTRNSDAVATVPPQYHGGAVPESTAIHPDHPTIKAKRGAAVLAVRRESCQNKCTTILPIAKTE